MPFSGNEWKKLTRAWYWELQPRRVVDIGAGAGTYADRFRPCHKSYWTAIEIWAPNLTEFELDKKYDKVIVADVRYVAESYLRADFTIAGDVIEHLPYEHVRPVIEKLLRNTKHLLISLPIIHYDQGSIDGNTFEAHHYHWGYDEMLELLNEIGTVEKSEKGSVLGVFLVCPK